jgi:hypothetical protein
VVEVSWRCFPLELHNAPEHMLSLMEAGAPERKGIRALRTALAVRAAAGNDGVARFYGALGTRTWDDVQQLGDDDVVRSALVDAGLEPALHDRAQADAGTWEQLQAEYRAVNSRVGAFGVATIVLDDGDGPGLFGPVISRLPDDDDAVELWRHVSWLTRYENFSELKRDRTIPVDLEHARVKAARRAAKA